MTTPDAPLAAALVDIERLRAELEHARRERHQLEAQLRQARALETVARLATGVAHDFNNLVTVIAGYSELLSKRVDPKDVGLRRGVEGIQRAVEWGAVLTRQLLAVCRREPIVVTVIDVNDVITGALPLLRLIVGEEHRLVLTLDPDVPSVSMNLGQLEQVITNLVSNSRDALVESGQVTVATGRVELSEEDAARLGAPQAGRYLRLSVDDTGSGMDDEIQVRLFEPGFTTKSGKGTGLGLVAVRDIVVRSGGAIRVESHAGQGSTFEIYLPIVEEAGGPRLNHADVPQGTETVLVVEDEPVVRELMRDVLRLHGYTVLEAGDGEGALRLSERHRGPIHLLIVDVVLPGLNSAELVHRIAATRGGIRTLYTSGYTDQLIRQHGLLRVGRDFLQKPFTVEALAQKVRELLDEE